MSIVVYGATGYVGGLVLDEAARRGIPVVAAGRPSAALEALGPERGITTRAARVDDPDALASALAGASVLLNLAGPFATTASPLAAACARAGVHYLDIAGEATAYERVREQDAAARTSGAMLLPGAAFGVVPMDCLAAAVHGDAPQATGIRITMVTRGGVSAGTLSTLAGNASTLGRAFRDGRAVPADRTLAVRTERVGGRRVKVVENPWHGSLVTLPIALGPSVRDVEVSFAVPGPVRWLLQRARRGGDGAPSRSANVLRAIARRAPAGPSARRLAKGSSVVRAVATDARGAVVAERELAMADAYVVTVDLALRIARTVAGGEARPGFTTASQLLGTRPLEWLTPAE